MWCLVHVRQFQHLTNSAPPARIVTPVRRLDAWLFIQEAHFQEGLHLRKIYSFFMKGPNNELAIALEVL